MSNNRPATNLPVVAALGGAVMLVLIVALLVAAVALGGGLDEDSTPLVNSLIGLVVLAVPSLIAAAFAERASRDIRNGTVVEKVRQGASMALDERGAQVAREGAAAAIDEAQVVTRTGPVVTTEMAALAAILERLTTHAEGTPPHPPEAPK